MGVDTVISTVTGTPQLRLIEAAVQARVRRFAPAEFEGRPSLRLVGDPLDRGRAAALALLQHYSQNIKSTVFVCGIFYERFAVGGLASLGIGINSGAGGEGDYILDARNMTAQAPAYNTAGGYTSISMTSVYDVGRFVVRALDMTSWPAELTMCGERVLVSSLIQTVRQCRGTSLGREVKALANSILRKRLRTRPVAQSRDTQLRADSGTVGWRPCETETPSSTHRNGRRTIRLYCTWRSQYSISRHTTRTLPKLVRS